MFRWSELVGEALLKGDMQQLALCVLSHPASKCLKRETAADIFDWSLGVEPPVNGRKMLLTMAEAMLEDEI